MVGACKEPEGAQQQQVGEIKAINRLLTLLQYDNCRNEGSISTVQHPAVSVAAAPHHSTGPDQATAVATHPYCFMLRSTELARLLLASVPNRPALEMHTQHAHNTSMSPITHVDGL